MRTIFHIARRADWDSAIELGEYAKSTIDKTLAEEGFIHCSNRDQVLGVANARYRAEDDLLLLTIDTAKLDSPVKDENTSGGTELFPHMYGPLNVTAVIAVAPLIKGQKGDFLLPPA